MSPRVGSYATVSPLARAFLMLMAAFVLLPDRAAAQIPYDIQTLIDPGTSNVEHRFLRDGFHFSTLLETPEGAFVFRPRPDQGDDNGFGSSYRLSPFLSTGAAGGVSTLLNTVTAGGIDVMASGEVGGTAGAGTWSWNGIISYDAIAQEVSGTGTLDVTLPSPLSGADLNLYEIASNYLVDVPLQTGGFGNTGDMSRIHVNYAPEGDPLRDFSWPLPADGSGIPSDHFPTDTSSFLGVNVIGEINAVDTLALGESFQIDIARKPTLSIALTSLDASELISFGVLYDESESQAFFADNVNVFAQVRDGVTSDTSMSFGVEIFSVAVPEPSTVMLAVLSGLAVAGYGWRRRRKRPQG